jgi:hypothetical protein
MIHPSVINIFIVIDKGGERTSKEGCRRQENQQNQSLHHLTHHLCGQHNNKQEDYYISNSMSDHLKMEYIGKHNDVDRRN